MPIFSLISLVFIPNYLTLYLIYLTPILYSHVRKPLVLKVLLLLLSQLIGPQFILAIKPSLEDQWTDETHAAWTSLFAFMGVIMKEAMAAEEAAQRAQ